MVRTAGGEEGGVSRALFLALLTLLTWLVSFDPVMRQTLGPSITPRKAPQSPTHKASQAKKVPPELHRLCRVAPSSQHRRDPADTGSGAKTGRTQNSLSRGHTRNCLR